MNDTRHSFGHPHAETVEPPAGGVEQPANASFRVLAALGAVIAGCVRDVAGIVFTWHERHRQRHMLDGLSDQMLKDMGLSRADVEREVGKRFWRE